MRKEYIRNGIPESRVHSFVYEIAKPHEQNTPEKTAGTGARRQDTTGKRSWNLLFVGRMELLKGGATLLEALPTVAEQLGGPIRLTLAGEGPQKKAWEKKASKLHARHPGLDFRFVGWLDKRRLDQIYSQTDLLVVPSLWPEPFGRVGPEAGLRGIPVAAFDVGGVSDWLVNGVNGYLASGDPPTADGLAVAIVKCLQDLNVYRELRKGATTVAAQFSLEHHLNALNEVFHQVRLAVNV